MSDLGAGADARTGTFGPSALLTPANALTIARAVVTPILLVLIVAGGASYPVLAFWIVLALSDVLDGHLARKHGTTRSGAFLDPLADKLLVLGALVALVITGAFWWLPVVLVGLREAVISAYRYRVARRGISVPARGWAKVKTVVQAVAVGFALLPATEDHEWVASSVLWVAVVLTAVTGAQYLLDGTRVARAV